MLTKRGSILIAAIGTILCFLSISYVSCTKVGKSAVCDGVVCENGGFCANGLCLCPVGYEGANCGTASLDKFYGQWTVTATVTGSDSIHAIGVDSTYQMYIVHSATPTALMINNFLGDPYYNQIVGVLDSVNSNTFHLDTATFSPPVYFDHLSILPNSSATYNASDNSILGSFIIHHVNKFSNWQTDTITLSMRYRKI